MNPQPLTTEPAADREPRDCETCGSPFAAIVVLCLGARIVARHCPQCVADHEADMARRQQGAAVCQPPTVEERWQALCPLEFRTTGAEQGRTDLARLSAECPEFYRIVGWRCRELGLLLWGPTGQRKTRVVWRLLRRLFDEGRTVIAMTAGEFGRSYADAAGAYQSSAWFDRMATVDALFIDDLGKAAWSDAVRAVFFDLVDKRTREGRALLLTTNDDGEAIAGRMKDASLGDPLVRRLRGFCEVVEMNAKNPA